MKSKKQFIKNRKGVGYLPALFLIIALAWYISAFHYQLMMIQGNSMSPSYHNMQLVVLEKQPELFSYGDVIAFQCDGLDAVLVKRVAACPGDMVQIKNGTLYVNDVVSEIYPETMIFEYAGIVEEAILLDAGEYFAIGDNVAESKDSRYPEIGVVNGESVLGRVITERD